MTRQTETPFKQFRNPVRLARPEFLTGHMRRSTKESLTGIPAVGDPLPNASTAVIEPNKLVDYALNAQDPVGRHKAIVFERALGIEQGDWEYLRDAILDELPRQPISGSRPPLRVDERYTWEVLVPIRGLGAQVDRILLVTTGWEMVEGVPRLITTRVAPKNRQPIAPRAYNRPER